jgi:hypothetical protein
MPTRDVVFVSHANPEDNEFAKWLTLKLVGLGFRAWSDVTRLLGGEDFWSDIERVIRDHTVKFLYVLSRQSNHKEGALREVRVADIVRKQQGLTDFIIPLRIDDLPFGDSNIELARLNATDFSNGWAGGLRQLVEKLEGDGVPHDARFNHATVRQWWDNAFNVEDGIRKRDERHLSNWFNVTLPSDLWLHTPFGLSNEDPAWAFPTKFRNGILTFAPPSDLESGLGTLRIESSVRMPTTRFLSEGSRDVNPSNRDVVTELLAKAWELFGASRGLSVYRMSGGRLAFYFAANSLPEPDVRFTTMDGRTGRRALMGYRTVGGMMRHWHFAVSAKPAVHPQPMLMLRTHVLFSDDGKTLWTSPEAMHRARRSQCAQWWNDDWRDRLLATMNWLSRGEQNVRLPLGASVFGVMPAMPLEFMSPVTLDEQARVADDTREVDELEVEIEDDDTDEIEPE